MTTARTRLAPPGAPALTVDDFGTPGLRVVSGSGLAPGCVSLSPAQSRNSAPFCRLKISSGLAIGDRSSLGIGPRLPSDISLAPALAHRLIARTCDSRPRFRRNVATAPNVVFMRNEMDIERPHPLPVLHSNFSGHGSATSPSAVALVTPPVGQTHVRSFVGSAVTPWNWEAVSRWRPRRPVSVPAFEVTAPVWAPALRHRAHEFSDESVERSQDQNIGRAELRQFFSNHFASPTGSPDHALEAQPGHEKSALQPPSSPLYAGAPIW